MKNPGILFTAVVILFLKTNTFAQQHKFEAGVEGGGGFASLWGNPLIEEYNKQRLGFAYGATFQYNFPQIFSIRTNLFYERKGCRSIAAILIPEGTNSMSFNTRSNFDYMVMPVLLRAGFGKKIKYFINAGPYFGYLIRQTYNLRSNNAPKKITDNTSHFDRYDVGLTTGIGFSVPITKILVLSFEVRNNLGLHNISKFPVYNSGTINTSSTNLLLGLAYKFGARGEVVK